MPKQSEFTLDDDTKFIIENWPTMMANDIASTVNKSVNYVSTLAKKLNLGKPYNPENFEGIKPTKTSVYWRRSMIPGILVSEAGDIWDTEKGRCPFLVKMDNGSLAIGLVRNDKTYKSTLAKLVYEAFKGPISVGDHVVHNDGITTNDDVSNLSTMNHQSKDRVIKIIEERMINRIVTAIDLCGKKEVKLPKSIMPSEEEVVYQSLIPNHKVKNEDKYIRRKVMLLENGRVVKLYDNASQYANSKGFTTAVVKYHLAHPYNRSQKITDDIRYAPEGMKDR